MAGRGPAPKQHRRRRNTPTAGDWITLPDEPYKGTKPRRPPGLHDRAVRTWEQWWASPMAHMWDQADHPGIVRLIRLIDQFEKTGSTKNIAEIRLQEERFGLSPKGRQGIRWRLPHESPQTDTEPAPTSDRAWSTLEVVA